MCFDWYKNRGEKSTDNIHKSCMFVCFGGCLHFLLKSKDSVRLLTGCALCSYQRWTSAKAIKFETNIRKLNNSVKRKENIISRYVGHRKLYFSQLCAIFLFFYTIKQKTTYDQIKYNTQNSVLRRNRQSSNRNSTATAQHSHIDKVQKKNGITHAHILCETFLNCWRFILL